jgi:transposase
MPKAHQKHLEWTPTRLVRWGEKIGPETGRFVEALLADRPHPEQGYRSCLGILRLARQYGAERLEAASRRALAVRSRSYRDVAAILKNGLDRVPLIVPAAQGPHVVHENIRGPEYYR